jgi:hypothetical protein
MTGWEFELEGLILHDVKWGFYEHGNVPLGFIKDGD